MIIYNGIELTKKLIPVADSYMRGLKENWYSQTQKIVSNDNFIQMADAWFKSSKLVTMHNWDQFPCIDTIMGNTHFIESFIMKFLI